MVRENKISTLQATLLINRGIRTPEDAHRYLHSTAADLYDPFLMKDMRKTVARIIKAVRNRERMMIYGDFDVDGVTAIVVLKKAVDILGGLCDFYVPQRLTEGYGLRKEAMDEFKRKGYTLVVSVDCGIRAVEVAEHAETIGLDLIVTDHHLPGDTLPRCHSILNPKQKDCPYPEKNLAGVGVVYKLVQALFRAMRREREAAQFLNLVAIGTVADLVSLTDENRIIVKHGLENLRNPENVGLKTLIEMSGIRGKEISCIDVAFKIAPRINAVGRMGGTTAAVDLFDSDDPEFVHSVVRDMNRKNVLRQQEENIILAEIDEMMKVRRDIFDDKVLVIAGKNWHRGVIGIVASRMVETFHRPTIVLSIENGEAHGSGRSTSKFHLLRALQHCDPLLARYGGHALAAGLSLLSENIDQLRRNINEYATGEIQPADLMPELSIDSLLDLNQISFKLLDEINELAPFGEGNPIPVFASRNVKIYSGPWLLKDKHLKFKVGNVLQNFDAVWWKRGNLFDRLIYQKQISIAYSLLLNEFNGVSNLQLNLRDIKFPHEL
ncbi:MAG: single-stranded-DNA-specific exonuclease RecJ [Acidobacteria bacterium]|nr:single-stranded-DNA-specific exonuclease RecJ [Acidobacteriota bacterium]